ncbi:MAG TPA: BatD family protein [Saprospiraceae bacterium]|nr:BatD family protein [Saprospiraceae bacterium]
MRNVLFIFSLLLWNALSLNAQGETRFYAEVKATEVAVGDPVKVSFVLENGKNNGRFTPPDWQAAGFLLLGSSQSSNISISNGEATSSATYQYTITPMEEGTWTIPSVRIKSNGTELQTQSIEIHAVPNADGTRPARPRSNPFEEPAPEPKKRIKTIKM